MQQNYSIDVLALLKSWYAIKSALTVDQLDAIDEVKSAIFSWVSYAGVEHQIIDCDQRLVELIKKFEEIHHALFEATIPVLKLGSAELHNNPRGSKCNLTSA